MGDITPQQVLNELASIAFADPEAEGGQPVKTADKLKALDMLCRYLGLDEGGGSAAVTIIDDVPAAPGS